MTDGAGRPQGARAVIRNRNFALLWSGGLVSDLGDWMLLVALPVYVFKLTGSALATSTVFAAELIPALVVGQVAGVLVDRWNRRRVLVYAGLVQAVLLLPLLAVTTADRIWIIYAVAAAQSCLARLCAPAKAALVPSLVPPGRITAANSLIAVSDNLARLVGATLGGLAIEFLGLPGVVVVDAVTFLAAAALIAGVRDLPDRAAVSGLRSGPVGRGRAGILGEWLDGLTTIRRNRPLPATLAVGALAQVAQGVFLVLFPVFVLVELHGDGAEVGLLRGVQAVGGILGGLLIGLLSRRLTTRTLVGWGFIGFGLVGLALWNAPQVTTALGLYIGLFIAAGPPGVACATGLLVALQTSTPPTHLGRVVAVHEAASGGLQAVGVLTAGALADRLGVLAILNAQAGLYLLCGLLAFLSLRAMPSIVAPRDQPDFGHPVARPASARIST